MSIRVSSLASSSKGNCYLVRSKEKNILIDAGISGRQTVLKLEKLGLTPEDIDGVFITHEHSDHIGGVKVLLKKFTNAEFFSTFETAEKLGFLQEISPLKEGCSVEFGDMKIKSFPLSHDAINPVGYSVVVSGKKFSVVTDTGAITQEIFDNIYDSDILFLEANYEPEILKISSYPRSIKERIASDKGHLSNEAAAKCIVDIVKCDNRERQILLSHISMENNSPDLAQITIRNILENEILILR